MVTAMVWAPIWMKTIFRIADEHESESSHVYGYHLPTSGGVCGSIQIISNNQLCESSAM